MVLWMNLVFLLFIFATINIVLKDKLSRINITKTINYLDKFLQNDLLNFATRVTNNNINFKGV